MAWEKQELKDILDKDFMNERHAFYPGRRNDDAVDFSIICWCLGLDPMQKFDELCKQHGFSITDYSLARDHMERVALYLNTWGAKGTDEAMVYSINY